MRKLLPALALLVFASTSAFAQDGAQDGAAPAQDGPALQLRSELLQSFTPHDGRIWGVGMGLELRHYPGSSNWRWGPWAETRYEIEGAWRVGGGVRVGYGAMALELGAEHRTLSDDYAATTGITIGKRITFGPVGLGYRLTIPVRDVQPEQGPALAERQVEHTFMLTAGWTFDLVGSRARHGSCHGHGSWGGKHGNR